ncbi:MAG: hypothetical protein AAF682_24585 [Planctomycetota bacterium]
MVAGGVALLAGLLALTVAHPNSISSSHITVEGASVRIELSFQTLTLIEELPVDDDGDLLLDDDELERHRATIESYVLEHLVLRSGGVDGTVLGGRVEALAPVVDPAASSGLPMLGQWLDLTLAYDADAPVEDFVVSWHLFEVMNAEHFDYAELVWNDEEPQSFVFGLGTRVWRHEPWAERRPRVVADFRRRGLEAALDAWPTLALLAVLACAARGRRGGFVGVALGAQLAAVALGTLALGLGVAERGLPPAAFLELAAPLSVAYVATDTLVRRAPRNPLLEALAFGAVHGFAAALPLVRDVGDEPQGGAAIAGLLQGWGVVMGGAAIVAAALLAGLPGDRRSAEGAEDAAAPGWLAPRVPRIALSVAAAAAGFVLFARRAGFFG